MGIHTLQTSEGHPIGGGTIKFEDLAGLQARDSTRFRDCAHSRKQLATIIHPTALYANSKPDTEGVSRERGTASHSEPQESPHGL